MDRFRRSINILVSAALLTSALAAPATAGKPRCAGKVATIVGTNKGEVIIGTPRADVIVARGGSDIVLGRGGNDIICGGPGVDRLVGNRGRDELFGALGRDRLFGGPGPDRLFGGAGNDLLDGGVGVDLCHQGPGAGPQVRCKLPAQVTPSPLGFRSLCEARSGTYVPGPKTYTHSAGGLATTLSPACEYAPALVGDWNSNIEQLAAACHAAGIASTAGDSRANPQWVGCVVF